MTWCENETQAAKMNKSGRGKILQKHLMKFDEAKLKSLKHTVYIAQALLLNALFVPPGEGPQRPQED